MRFISTLCLLLISSVCFSQIYDMIRAAEYKPQNTSVRENDIYICGLQGSLPIFTNFPTHQPVIVRRDSVNFRYKSPDLNILPTKKDTAGKPVIIRFRCMRTLTEDDNPLIVIDGVPLERHSLSSINPNDIESIYILKSSEASAIFGCRAAKGVILITTKSDKLRKFIIKDFLDGNRIPGATVSFISTDKKDTVIMAANDSGVVITDKLKSSNSYSITVSSVGYKTQTTMFQYNYTRKEKEILLEKNVNTCSEVVVSAVGLHRRIRCYGCGGRVINKKLEISNEQTTSSARIFPNPATKGKLITIETTTQSDEPIQVRLTSLDGKLLLSQLQKTFKGLNRFAINTDPRWATGIYFVQLYANGKLLASDKVIIQ